MKKHEHIVKSLMPGGIGEELGIEPGDKLLAINGNDIHNIYIITDVRFSVNIFHCLTFL